MESTSSGRRVRFGQFEIDEKTGELRKDGTKIRLQEQPLQILQILLEHPGELVARDELRKRVWPTDTFVDFDHGINNAVKRLREALGGYQRRMQSLWRQWPVVDTGLSGDWKQQRVAPNLWQCCLWKICHTTPNRSISRTG